MKVRELSTLPKSVSFQGRGFSSRSINANTRRRHVDTKNVATRQTFANVYRQRVAQWW